MALPALSSLLALAALHAAAAAPEFFLSGRDGIGYTLTDIQGDLYVDQFDAASYDGILNEVKWRRARITKRERAQKRKRSGPRAAPSAPIRAPLSSFWPLYNVFVPWIHERRAGRRASRPRCSARGSERFRVQAGAREAAAPGGVLRAPRTAEQPRRGAPARIHWDTTVVCDVRVDEGCASRRVSRRTGARLAARPAETCLLRD